MRIKVFVAIATNIKPLITLLLLNEINSKLGYEIATAYIVFPQKYIMQNSNAIYNSKNKYKLPIMHFSQLIS